MEYKFNIVPYAELLTGKLLSKGALWGRHWEGARVQEFVRARGDEWLYKLAAPYQPFKRGSRINLIWRVARFVFEGPDTGAWACGRPMSNPLGVLVWWRLRNKQWFSLSRLPLCATKTTRPDVTMPTPECISSALPRVGATQQKHREPSLRSAKILNFYTVLSQN